MKLHRNFLGGGRYKTKTLPWGKYGYLLGLHIKHFLYKKGHINGISVLILLAQKQKIPMAWPLKTHLVSDDMFHSASTACCATVASVDTTSACMSIIMSVYTCGLAATAVNTSSRNLRSVSSRPLYV